MRIGIDARWIFPELSGIGSYTQELIRALAALDRRNEYWLLFQRPELEQRVSAYARLEAAPNFKTERVPFGVFSAQNQVLLPGWLRRRGLEVFHSANYMIPFGAFPRRGHGRIKCVVTIHDMIPLLHPEWTPRALKTRCQPLFRRLMVEVGARAAVILTVSDAARQDILRLLRLAEAGPPAVVAVSNGVAPEYQPAAPGGVPLTGGAAAGEKTILYVGRFDPYKNVPGLLRAFARLRELAPGPVRLVLAGARDPRYPEAPELARALGLEPWIRWAGYVTGPELVRVYQQADVFVWASKYEGFGLPVLEAMACGTPVVCSNTSALPEVAGDAALLVDPADTEGLARALARVLAEPALAADLRAKGLRRAAGFTWQRTGAATLKVYEQAVSSTP
ncbi:MAG: glycosyltransferase family 1 protein [Kiritimatiellaeota bacterium]|nr:glycosyltransferase family 1 protein [Kiritimatiellota bacterium]